MNLEEWGKYRGDELSHAQWKIRNSENPTIEHNIIGRSNTGFLFNISMLGVDDHITLSWAMIRPKNKGELAIQAFSVAVTSEEFI